MAKYTPFRGVNLGGWLIVEKWLTPSLFSGTTVQDEWGLSRTAIGRARLRRHRKTFITEQDFAWLQSHGVTFVRLPVPYWAVVHTDEYVSAQKELDWAMKMAEQYGIKVLIDLHAVPGGQNTGDHSGRKGHMEWFERQDYQVQTLSILKVIARRYRDSPALWGIEIMNEPDTKRHVRLLKRFYRQVYRELRQIIRPGTVVVFHDGFRPLRFAGTLMRRSQYPVMMDVHWYAFPLRRIKKFKTYVRVSGIIRRWLLRWLWLWQPVIIGEWSSVLPQRFFDEQPVKNHTALLLQNIAMQHRAYARATGMMYWNYKAEGDGMWNYRWLVENEIY